MLSISANFLQGWNKTTDHNLKIRICR